MMQSQWSIGSRLRRLVLSTALPLFALGGYEVFVEVREEIARVEEAALGLARLTAVHTERIVSEAEWLLSGISERPSLKADKNGRCDTLFAHFRDIHPRFGNLLLFDSADRLACASFDIPGAMHAVPEATRQVVQQARAERKLIVGPAHRSAVSGEWVLLMAFPVRAHGQDGGVLGVSLGLTTLHPLAGSTSAAPPEGAYFAILDRDGTAIARSHDSETTVGRNFRNVPAVAEILTKRQGTLHAADKDGMERIIGFMPIAGTNWLAVAGLPTERMTASMTRVAAEHAAFIFFALAVVGFLAWRLALRISQPTERIAEAARAIGLGGSKGRLPVEGPGEIAEVAEQLNRTLDALTEREEQLRAMSVSLEQRVAERTADLERANAELESFSYSVSHDLRAPLRALNGYASILAAEEGGKLSPEGRAHLERIARNAVRMGELIDDLLQFSRVGRDELRRESVNLSELARSLADELREAYPSARVTVGLLPVVSADAAMLRQVFANLIGNALKFSSKRSDPLVEVGMAEQGGQQAIYVRDNGEGFDMRYAGKLFGVFQRMHKESEFPGTGVGLAIVKRIVERHGGRVWAEAAPGAGATFYFTLP
jgi:signal transduction histidine kinase